MAIDTKKLEQSLEKGDFAVVKSVIDDVISEKISDKERGSVWVDFAETYLDVLNSINARYESVLREAIKGMSMIDKSESKMKDSARVLELKASLK